MNREELFAFKDFVIEEVTIPEWGNAVFYVRSLSAGEKAQWETGHLVDVKKKDRNTFELTREKLQTVRERLVELATCKQDGTRYFNKGDAAEIGKKNSKAVSRLYDVAARLSGISDEDAEEVAKNSEAVEVTG